MESLIKKLCACKGNSEITNFIVDFLRKYANVEVDKNKNIIAKIKANKPKKHIAIDAHLDTIYMLVTHIDENGFLSFTSCGGIDAKYLPGLSVTILGREKISGIVTTLPPHVNKNSKEKDISIDSLYIDTGLRLNKLKEIVEVGDKVIFSSDVNKLLNDNIASCYLDNKASIAAILYLVKNLDIKNLPIDLSLIFTQNEETTGSGAAVSTYSVSPDETIVVDVSFATQPGVSDGVYAKLGNGPIIGQSPVLSQEITNKFKNLAKLNNINYSVEVMGGRTATNADEIATVKSGIPCANVFIPLRYMHSPVEVVNLSDINNTSKLLNAYIESFKEN